MSQNKYKTKLKKEMAEALLQVLVTILTNEFPNDDGEGMFYSLLEEIRVKIETKLIEYKPVYNFSFSPAQGFALGELQTYYVPDFKTYLGNQLLKISNEVTQQFTKH